ncbi:MAG: RNA-directed DNA polymerase [Planctomycetes bacterium]|nr:RNA-directed DNA polymerase [Planctomycetota bacterium]
MATDGRRRPRGRPPTVHCGAGQQRGIARNALRRAHHARLPPDWPPRGQGLPMGAVTSQLLASHLVLTAMDHRILRELRVPGAVRYVDDVFLFGDRRADLRAWRSDLVDWLLRERRQRWKHPQARVLSCAAHLDGLGFRIRRDGVEPLPAARRRVEARLRAQIRDPGLSVARVRRSVAAALGHQFVL